MDVGMTLEPAVVPRLVGVEMARTTWLLLRILGDKTAHEVKEFEPLPTFRASRRDRAGGEIEGGEEGRVTMPLVALTVAEQRPSIWQLEVPLGSFSAWIDGFSSTQMTIASSGAAMYCRPRQPPWRRLGNVALPPGLGSRRGRCPTHAESARPGVC